MRRTQIKLGIPLEASGGTVTVSVDVDLDSLSTEDKFFLAGLLGEAWQYLEPALATTPVRSADAG